MKRMNGKRGVLRAAALGQVLLLVVAGCKSPGEKVVSEEAVRLALAGKDGNVQINAANTVVNGYSALTGTPNANQVTVNDITDFRAGGRPALAVADLVLIIQMQGATIATPNDATYGNVSNYNNAGNYEFAEVSAIAGNTITLGCNRQNAYTAAGNAQVIRVPQYDTLTVTGAGSITAQTWNGTVGGVVAVQAATTLQLNGSIDVSGKGFRGGAVDAASDAIGTQIAIYRSTANTDGAEKGESIAGLAAGLANGRYGRGAPANGGGGGNSHNAGGGGGANATASGTWTGEGLMSAVTGATVAATSAWRLDPGYTANGNAPTTSSGGGRGGYTYSANQHDPTAAAEGPGAANWGGNLRSEHGGLGGHPLTASVGGKLFLGGGGGAGDGDNGHPGPGGQGGGLVFVIAGTVQGAGSIVANGAPGGAVNTGNGISSDAAGGGGGGGTVIVRAATLSQISVAANGGLGGSQTVNNVYEAEGPGGGGGGGYVALSGGAPASVSASGVLGGTTNSAGVAQFPTNGATAGHDGVTDGVASTFLYCTSPNTTIATFPSNPTGVAVGSFTFTSPQSAVTFECSLDGAAYAACDADYTTPVLSNAAHTIDVRAKDINGNVDATPAHYAWTVNAAGLDTAIASAPATLTNVAAATFAFTSNPTTGVTFQCSLDSGAWTTCAASYTTPALTDGTHTISVRARDSGGNVDGTPATYTWVVDLILPTTAIVTSPPDPTNSPTGDFTFSGTDAGGGAVTFECRIDSAAFAACPASFTAGPLADGTHTLDVRARDVAGNVDATPATYTWAVHLLGLDAAIPDSAVPDSALIDTAPIIPDSAVPDTRPDSAIPDLAIVVVPDARLDSPAVDLAPLQDGPVVGTPDARADASDADADGGGLGLADAFADVVGRDAVVPDTRVVVDLGSPDAIAAIPDLLPAPVPDTAVPVIPDAAEVIIPPPEPLIPNPKVMGSGFCSVNSMPGSAPGLFTFFLVAAFGLLISRRRR